MALITGKELLQKAKREKYAVGAFNINNMEILQAIMSAAQEEESPAIIAVSEGAIKYAGLTYLISMVGVAAGEVDVPLTLHLDHGRDLEVIRSCIESGFTSVMIDGSHLDFEENISITKKVGEMAHTKGVSVEGELGRLQGIEDGIDGGQRETFLTDPGAAREFVERTQVDSLAVAIGTSHGAYKFKGEVQLDFQRLHEIVDVSDVPLVLHGASGVPPAILEKSEKYGARIRGAQGVPDDSIREAIKIGISKINIDTDLRLSFVAGIREALTLQPQEFDPRRILGPARKAVEEIVRHKMKLFGSSGRAQG
jgi:fructose-bisphosphate aldolase class II